MKFHTNWLPRLTKEFMLSFHDTIIALESFQGTCFHILEQRELHLPTERHTHDWLLYQVAPQILCLVSKGVPAFSRFLGLLLYLKALIFNKSWCFWFIYCYCPECFLEANEVQSPKRVFLHEVNLTLCCDTASFRSLKLAFSNIFPQ